jgi:hypothetical protein
MPRSHLKALKAACSTPASTRSQYALVLEDDASFLPMAWWPRPLREMLASFPSGWTVANAAPTNNLESMHSADKFEKQRYWRDWGGLDDWGTVAVMCVRALQQR